MVAAARSLAGSRVRGEIALFCWLELFVPSPSSTLALGFSLLLHLFSLVSQVEYVCSSPHTHHLPPPLPLTATPASPRQPRDPLPHLFRQLFQPRLAGHWTDSGWFTVCVTSGARSAFVVSNVREESASPLPLPLPLPLPRSTLLLTLSSPSQDARAL